MDANPDPTERMELLVSEYVDGLLSDSEREAFERRLEGEPELGRVLQQYRRIDALVGDWGRGEPELDWDRFEAQVRQRRRALDAPRRGRAVLFKFLVPMSAAAGILLAVSVWRSISPIDQSRTEVFERIASVVVSRPMAAESASRESFVSYGYDPGDEEEDVGEPPRRRPMIAKAVVGGPAHWPGLGRAPSAY